MRAVSFLAILPRWLALCLGLFGAQALAGYASVPDGYVLLSTNNSNRYVVAGGARFYIPPAQHSLYSGATTVALPQATIDSYTQIPQEGTLIRQKGTAEIYVVVGQAYWWIPSPTELDFWDDWRMVNDIPNSDWRGPFINPSYNVLVQERSTSQIYLWVAGAKYPVTTSADLDYFGGLSSVKVVPLGTLASTTYNPWCGTNLRERSSSTVYTMGYINSSSTTMRKSVTAAPANSAVPDGALASIPLYSAGLACIW
ncbi:hypothetical protein D7V97_28860 [Corallococcus sp. CA053C]|uniref:hypothetical protein n=1 Tax=Corallococcus sp. CA053C TaxID=2316732 RepID=UPI000EA18E6F|nr:hypothetical protein [Corallococcus sp. CA053C]RKH01621.1 hypothetical protein D7V97_28860 [Corallococcus sp. CA053C]